MSEKKKKDQNPVTNFLLVVIAVAALCGVMYFLVGKNAPTEISYERLKW